MAIVMQMHWKELTKSQYEKVRKAIAMETDVPAGAKLHVAWFEDGLHVLDLWDSKREFEQFVVNRLMPAVEKTGIKGKPEITYAKCHAIFAPNVEPPSLNMSGY